MRMRLPYGTCPCMRGYQSVTEFPSLTTNYYRPAESSLISVLALNLERLTIGSEAHPLVANVPYTVVVLQQAPANDPIAAHGINQRLARRGLALERTDAELAAGDCY